MKRNYLPMPTSLGAFDPGFASRVRSDGRDLLLLSALSQRRYIASSGCALWLDLMDLWSSFARREAARRTGFRRLAALAQSRQLQATEKRLVNAAALVTVAGWADRKTLLEQGLKAHWLPTPIDDSEFGRVGRVGDPRPSIGLVANFDYWPNRDALQLLLTHWREGLVANGWQIVIAGRGSDTIKIDDPSVKVLGPLVDVNTFYSQVDATVAPIRLGGGIKVKVIESLTRGVPVVGTEFAFDGFPPQYLKFFRQIDSSGRLPMPRDLVTIDVDDALIGRFRQSALSAKVEKLLRNRLPAVVPGS